MVRKSVEYLHKHFDMARADKEETKNQKLIDRARVNLGIAQANTMIENYKYLILEDLNGLLDWKIRRQPVKRWKYKYIYQNKLDQEISKTMGFWGFGAPKPQNPNFIIENQY